jgi:Plasma-membrane choline transporter
MQNPAFYPNNGGYKPLEVEGEVYRSDGPIQFEKRKSNLDDRFLGDRLPNRLGDGPVQVKRSTDTICLVLFCLLFIGLISMILVFMIGGNNAYKLSKPLDSEARVCGDEVKGYPYLYMFKFEANYRSVCVKNCPKFDYNQIKYNSDGSNKQSIEPLYFENYGQKVPSSYTYNTYTRQDPFSYDPQFASGYFTSAQFDTYRSRLVMECSPNNDVAQCKHDPSKQQSLYDSRLIAMNLCTPLLSGFMRRVSFLGDVSKSFTTTVTEVWWMYILAVISALLLTALFTLATSYFVTGLIWTFGLLIFVIFLAIGITVCVFGFNDNSPYFIKNKFDPDFVWLVAAMYKLWYVSLIVGLVLIALSIVIIYNLLVHSKSIAKCSLLLGEAVRMLLTKFHLAIFAMTCFILQLGTIALAVWLSLCIYSSGEEIRDGEKGSPFLEFRLGFWKVFLLVVIIFSCWWTFCFWNNFSDFLASAVTVDSYFNKNKNFFQTLKDVMQHNLGTISLCSLIMPPISVLQFCLGWLFDAFTATGLEGDPNIAQFAASKVCICFVWPYKKFILRMQESGYAMVYMASSDFCPSSKETYYLFLGYEDKIGQLDFVLTLYKVFMSLGISILNATIFFYLFKDINHFQSRVSSPMLMGTTVLLLTLILAIIFLNILTTVVQTLALCLLIQHDTGKVISNNNIKTLLYESAH